MHWNKPEKVFPKRTCGKGDKCSRLQPNQRHVSIYFDRGTNIFSVEDWTRLGLPCRRPRDPHCAGMLWWSCNKCSLQFVISLICSDRLQCNYCFVMFASPTCRNRRRYPQMAPQAVDEVQFASFSEDPHAPFFENPRNFYIFCFPSFIAKSFEHVVNWTIFDRWHKCF